MFWAKDDQERRWGSKGRLGQNTPYILMVFIATQLNLLPDYFILVEDTNFSRDAD